MRFELPLPPPLNACYGVNISRQGRPYSYKRRIAKEWQDEACLIIWQQVGNHPPSLDKFIANVELHVIRDRDIDSSHKLLLDTLQTANIIKNDKQIVELNTKKVYPSKVGKLVVELFHVEPDTGES